MAEKDSELERAAMSYEEVDLKGVPIDEVMKKYNGKKVVVADLRGKEYFGRLDCMINNGKRGTHYSLTREANNEEEVYTLPYSKVEKLFVPPHSS